MLDVRMNNVHYCRICGRAVKLNKSGKVRAHKPPRGKKRCIGSRREPEPTPHCGLCINRWMCGVPTAKPGNKCKFNACRCPGYERGPARKNTVWGRCW